MHPKFEVRFLVFVDFFDGFSVLPPNLLRFCGFGNPSGPPFQTSKIALRNVQEQNSPRLRHHTSDTTPHSPSPSKVEEKLNLIITHLSNLDLKITASSHVLPASKESTPTPASQHQTTFFEDLEERLRLCETLSDICSSFDELPYI